MERRLRVALGFAIALLPALAAIACGGPQDPGEEGETCYRDADCQLGLVCVPSGDSRVCSKNVSGLVSQVDRPPPPEDAGTTDDAGEPPADGG
jgi:hypothetical protein